MPDGEQQRLEDLPFLTVAQVAQVLQCTHKTVYRLVSSGELAHRRFGGRIVIPNEAVFAETSS